jgi:hypothetical protein
MTVSRRDIFLSTLAAVSLFAASGCGKGKLHQLEGVVIDEKGQPLAGATVTFVPADGNARPASGLTGDDGSFRLTTFNTGDGAREGDYKVTVKVSEAQPDGGAPPSMNDPAAITKAMQEYGQKNRGKKPGEGVHKKPAVHPNYSDPKKTPLRQHVPSDGKVELKLNSSGN